MEAMRLRQAYWQVKGDLVCLHEEAKVEDKINLHMQVQASAWGNEPGCVRQARMEYWGVVGSMANWEAYALWLISSGLSSFKKVGVVPDGSDFVESQRSKFFIKHFCF